MSDHSDTALHAATRMNRPTGLALGALSTVAGVFSLNISDIRLPLAIAIIAIIAAAVWVWIALKRAGKKLHVSGAVIAWATLSALVLSVIVSVAFALQGPTSEWTGVVIMLALIYVAPIAVLTALLLSLFARALLKPSPRSGPNARA